MSILERRPAVAARRPLAAVTGGLLAGTVGALAMALLWYGRYGLGTALAFRLFRAGRAAA
jgi:hypothetical protein